MAAVTPAQLALELGTSQRSIRDYLRERYGTLSDDVTRWELDAEQVRVVRDHLAGTPAEPKLWPLEPGDVVKRREIHAVFGGQSQGGISTPRSRPDVLIFTDPGAGKKYGYDRYEGLREDGSYAYTGEGQYGDQEFLRGNRALRDSAEAGKTIRLFRTRGVFATYVGAFTTDTPPYLLQTIPDVDGNPRRGIIFNLVPISAQVDLLPSYGGASNDRNREYAAHEIDWQSPEFGDVIISGADPDAEADRTLSRIEFKLQSEFGAWLVKTGTPPKRLHLQTASTTIDPDFYVPQLSWVVEAKKSTARGHVRMAIGQVLDYVHVAEKCGVTVEPVILLPGLPEADLRELMQKLGIALIVQTDAGFERIRD